MVRRYYKYVGMYTRNGTGPDLNGGEEGSIETGREQEEMEEGRGDYSSMNGGDFIGRSIEAENSEAEVGDEDDFVCYGSEMKELLKSATTSVLCFLTSACLSRFTERDFQRFLACHPPPFRLEASSLWNFRKGQYSIRKFCNSCGVTASRDRCDRCDGKVLKFIRIGAFSQLVDLVDRNLPKIMKLRENLKSGRNSAHNLNAEYLKGRWKSETSKELKLTLLASVDGVTLHGNTKKKIWPITLKLADLPTSEMQKSINILLQGVIEGSENPSTVAWNQLLPTVFMDVEGRTGEAGGNDTYIEKGF
ncbi:hypothetical protein GCK72_003002 [Caenorhabditis remanei]|uniref:Uncharacterized protein n=1 Tax=Caenorhabditis remanei TaxID=31234 RepID=A0A6A5HWD0_CAERE|nr:hypothetical protein GCK72_003002 [Caenorhabditis remanei]KAF1771176.1 hypothetical protein GCK72_003002 [Caenorhabditis remanei]